jgi:multidrug efflux pump subunit AcrA (membrane-fusion protein)
VSLKINIKDYFLVTFVAIIIFLFIAQALATTPGYFEVTGYLREEGVEVAVPSNLAFLTQGESTPNVVGGAFKLPMAIGRVVKVTVMSGDQVKAGQVVALIDNRLAKARLEMITAQQEFVAAQKRLLEEKLTDLRESYTEISDKKQSLENASSTLKSMQLKQLSLAKGAIATAKKNLSEIEKSVSKAQVGLQQASRARESSEEYLIYVTRLPESPEKTKLLDEAQANLNKAVLAEKTAQGKLNQLLALESKLKSGLQQAEFAVKEIKRQFGKKEAKLKKALLKVKAAESEVAQAIEAIENKISAVQWRIKRIGHLKRIFSWLLDLTIIKTPISGRVRELKIAEGSVVFPGQPIAVISKNSVIKLDIYLPVNKLGKLKEGENVKVTATTLPDRIFRGKVAEVGKKAVFPPSSEASQSLHLIRVVKIQINIGNKEGLLKAGMSATAYVRSKVASGW